LEWGTGGKEKTNPSGGLKRGKTFRTSLFPGGTRRGLGWFRGGREENTTRNDAHVDGRCLNRNVADKAWGEKNRRMKEGLQHKKVVLHLNYIGPTRGKVKGRRQDESKNSGDSGK